MAIIRMGHSSYWADPTTMPDGAYSPIQWCQDRAVSIGNAEVLASEHRLFLYETHRGLCISERERNLRDDSDFLMLVWDEEAQAPYEIEFASTRGWTYPCYGSAPDATPEVLAAYEAWKRRQIARIKEDNSTIAAIRTVEKVDACHKGAIVRVARGRKVPKGITGRVLNIESVNNGYGTEEMALLDAGDRFVKVAARHCDIVTPHPELLQAAFDMAEAA